MAKKKKKSAARRIASAQRVMAEFSITPIMLNDAEQIYTQLKICLSKITLFPINQIQTTDNLSDKFHFTPGGLTVLAGNLEACFASSGHPIPRPLDRGDIRSAKTVGDLADVINDAFGL